MPNSGRCIFVYSCAPLNIAADCGNLQFGLVGATAGVPNRAVDKSNLGVAEHAQNTHSRVSLDESRTQTVAAARELRERDHVNIGKQFRTDMNKVQASHGPWSAPTSEVCTDVGRQALGIVSLTTRKVWPDE
jgi:hypothetical protein